MRNTVVGQMLVDENGKFFSTTLFILLGILLIFASFYADVFTSRSVPEVYHDHAKLLVGIMGVAKGVRGTVKNLADR